MAVSVAPGGKRKRQYTDVFGAMLTQNDVRLAVEIMSGRKSISPIALHRPTRWGMGKASNVLTLLCDAGVVTKVNAEGYRNVIIHDEQAVNAALRQLNKGRK